MSMPFNYLSWSYLFNLYGICVGFAIRSNLSMLTSLAPSFAKDLIGGQVTLALRHVMDFGGDISLLK